MPRTVCLNLRYKHDISINNTKCSYFSKQSSSKELRLHGVLSVTSYLIYFLKMRLIHKIHEKCL